MSKTVVNFSDFVKKAHVITMDQYLALMFSGRLYKIEGITDAIIDGENVTLNFESPVSYKSIGLA